jgi:hypothetical protein
MPRTVIFGEIGEADVLQIGEEPIIEPAEGEVRVKIEAFGINRADQMLRIGVYARPAQLPHARLGCEGTGIIDAVGPGVDKVEVGDAVVITAVPEMDTRGTYAEYTNVPATSVISRPSGCGQGRSNCVICRESTRRTALRKFRHEQQGRTGVDSDRCPPPAGRGGHRQDDDLQRRDYRGCPGAERMHHQPWGMPRRSAPAARCWNTSPRSLGWSVSGCRVATCPGRTPRSIGAKPKSVGSARVPVSR